MAKKKQDYDAAEKTFIRTLEVKDAQGEVVVTMIAQPYCVGMYVMQNSNQGTTNHKGHDKNVRKAIKAMEKDGLTVTVTESKYSDFLSVEDIENYIMKK